LCRPDDLIPSHHVYKYLEEGARASGLELLGMKIAKEHSFAGLGQFGCQVLEAVTVFDALNKLCSLMGQHTSAAQFWLAEANGVVWLCRKQICDPDYGRSVMEQYALMMLIQLIQQGAGTNWRPSRILLRSEPSPRLEETEDLYSSDIAYERPIMAFNIPQSIICKPFISTQRSEEPNSELSTERLGLQPPAEDWVGSLRQILKSLYSIGYPSIQEMAEITGLSVRTFQRRLGKAGLSYSCLVEQSRFELARQALRESDIKVTILALELGYSDVACFTRAFHRWSGVSPREFRRHVNH